MAVKQRTGAHKNKRGESHASIAAAHRVELPRHSKGRRPEFYENPAIDQLFAIVTALTGEVSVLCDRLDTLERVLERTRALAPDALNTYIAGGSEADSRVRRREELLRRVFAVLEAYAQRQPVTPQ